MTEKEGKGYTAFCSLDEALDKMEPVRVISYNIAPIISRIDPWVSNKLEKMEIYQLDNGVCIAREKCIESGSEELKVGPHEYLPGFEGESWHFSQESTFYFILENGVPITTDEKVKKLIKQATGVKLPELNVFKEDEYSPSFSGHEFIMDVKVLENRLNNETYSFENGCQPTEEDMAYGLDEIKTEMMEKDPLIEYKISENDVLEFCQQHDIKLPTDEDKQDVYKRYCRTRKFLRNCE